MIKRYTLLLILAFVGVDQAFGQDPNFTQFYANPLYLNPAFAGSARCPRLCMNYRNQWPAIAGTFVTSSVSYDQYVNPLHGGIGVQFMYDRAGAGTLNTLNASFIYAYQLNITREFTLKFGAQVTYSQRYIDWSKLYFGDQIDPRYGFSWSTAEIPPGNLNRRFADFSAGVMGYGEHYYFGVSVNHITQPNQSFWAPTQISKLPMKITAHAGATIPLSPRNRFQTGTTISPNILYQRQQAFQQLNIGMYVTHGPVVGGFWYRNRDSFIVLVGIQQNTFRIGYSYDVTLSKLTNATAGSHEVSLALVIPCKKKGPRYRMLDCPSF